MGPDYKLGLQRLKGMLLQKYDELPTEFASLETRLLKVLAEEQRYGSDNLIVKGNVNRVMDNLHSFTREHFTLFFNELCDPSYPQPIRERTVDGQGHSVLTYNEKDSMAAANTTPEERASKFAALQKGVLSWKEIPMLTIQGERYEIEHASVREWSTEDDGAILREARVRHVGTDLLLWLKQVHSLGPDRHGKIVQEMLEKERQILIDLENEGYRDFPYVFPLIDGESEKDFTFAYIATPDQSLKQAFSGLRQKPDKSAIERLIGNVLPLCGALSVLHGKNWSHRRLSPDELFLLKGRYAMLQNIGLAAALKPKKGECSGWYQAPEQREDNPDLTTIGPATDIYQLGAILYYLITNQLLSPSSQPGMYNPALSPQLNDAIARAVKRQPEERWPTIEAFATALKQAL